MGKSDLWRIFGWTAVASLLVFVFALPQSSTWALDFALWSTLANLNWLALAVIITGLRDGKPTPRLIAGAWLKLHSLAALVLAAWWWGIEISSFLAGLHIFMLVALIYGVLMNWRTRNSAVPSIPTESGL